MHLLLAARKRTYIPNERQYIRDTYRTILLQNYDKNERTPDVHELLTSAV